MNQRTIQTGRVVLVLTLLMWPGLLHANPLDTIVRPGVKAKVLGSGYGFPEGPAVDAGGNVYFSDGKKNSIHRYRAGQHAVELFVDDSTDANGMMFDRGGRLVVCEGAAYRIVAIDVKKKTRTVLVGGGKRAFNEPNDLAIDEVGGIYFTDPNYRHRGQERLKKADAYYRSPSGAVTRVSTICVVPNGILLSADNRTLYLADNRDKKIYRYDVPAPGKLTNERQWLNLPAHPDGMTIDSHGNLYIACGRAGILVYSKQGKLIGAIDRRYGVSYSSNCCFGGKDFSQLFITAGDKFLAIPTSVSGVRPLPAE